jgi:cytoskeletal protein CcmA (bactofilin family)
MLNVTPKSNGHNHGNTAPARARAFTNPRPNGSSESSTLRVLSNATPPPVPNAKEPRTFQAKIPVITGEAHYRGTVQVDGMLSGQMAAAGSSLNLRQKSRLALAKEPELSGEITFRDMVRVNGHIAGTVYSQKGTLIVDLNAQVDANVNVAVAVISGTVHGDIIAHERVELESAAKIYGNIWTRSIAIRDGAIFEGACRMIEEENCGE